MGITAQALNVAKGGLNLSVKYAKERVSSGQFIANYQAIQIEMVEMTTQVESRELLYLKSIHLKKTGD